MKSSTKLAVLTVAIALGAAPAFALGSAGGSPTATNTGTSHMPTDPGSQGTSHKPSTPGPSASLPSKAKAYGKYCQNESKAHVAGTPGTPFSKCVTDMAKLANGSNQTPRTACKNESKRHASGEHGTSFSQCMAGAAKLLQKQAASTTSS